MSGHGGYYGSARGGRGRGGGYGGGRGRGDGGRGGRGPDLSDLKMVKTNLIRAALTSDFGFYMYTTDSRQADGQAMDSRFRRSQLFYQAVFDNLLEHKSENDKKKIRKVVFFEGSFFFSTIAIEGLEADKLPRQLLTTAEQETFSVNKVYKFKSPLSMRKVQKQDMGADLVFMNCRCSCGGCFANTQALLQHCQDRGHKPLYDEEDTASLEPDDQFFLQFCNCVLAKALAEKLTKWGREFIHPEHSKEPRDNHGNNLGVTVFRAYRCDFGLVRKKGKGNLVSPSVLTLTVDLCAKIMRNTTVLDTIYNKRDPYPLSQEQKSRLDQEWRGRTIIYKLDKKCYCVVALRFDLCPDSHPVEGLGMTHTEYFSARKRIMLRYPSALMVEVLGRRNQTIYFPAELVCGNELDSSIREQLPKIASYTPTDRHAAVDEILAFLAAGSGGKTLASCGILLQADDTGKAKTIEAKATVLSAPPLVAPGISMPASYQQALKQATFNIKPNQANHMNVVIVHHTQIEKKTVMGVYEKLRRFVNAFEAAYRFPDNPAAVIEFQGGPGEVQNHLRVVEAFFAKSELSNVFVIDLMKPLSKYDPAYPVIKKVLGDFGYLSQCISFTTFDHGRRLKEPKSDVILQGAARQVLQKSGIRLWWTSLPRDLPLPTVFVGVDISHAPREYDKKSNRRVAKPSCAAIVVQVRREGSDTLEIYSETFRRPGGEEFGLESQLRRVIGTAMTELKVDPASCVVWRDGIADSSFGDLASAEVRGIREGLAGGVGRSDLGAPGSPNKISSGPAVAAIGALVPVSTVKTEDTKPPATGSVLVPLPQPSIPMAYVVCQKAIATKFLTVDGKWPAPSGTLVDGIQGLTHDTFYIQGRAPPFSTPKPVRFVIIQRDNGLDGVDLSRLTWDLCHDYPNWAGPIKVPSLCMAAHKLAMLAGNMSDSGQSLAHRRFKNTMHYL